MKNCVKLIGKLVVNPESRREAKKRGGEDWAIVPVPTGLADFYRTMLLDRYLHPKWLKESRKVHGTFWKPHITVLDNRVKLNNNQKNILKRYHNTKIEYEYDVSPYKHWKFWALRVYSPQLDEIRKEMGLSPYTFHITIAREE